MIIVMAIYTIKIEYKAHYMATVDAKDEGDALHKAREMAEEADANDFVLTEENESRVVSID